MADSIERIADEMDEAAVAYAGHHSSGTFRRLATRLRALSPAGGDWVMVPREPTPEMLKTLFSGAHSYDYREGNDYRREELDDYYLSMYRNLLAASPQQEPGVAVDEAMIERGICVLFGVEDAKGISRTEHNIMRDVLTAALAPKPEGGHG